MRWSSGETYVDLSKLDRHIVLDDFLRRPKQNRLTTMLDEEGGQGEIEE